ncbi:transposase, partial [uncultured Muribaculum sp.]
MDNWTSKYDFFLIFDAVLYVNKTGCQWRNLPHDYPVWQTVYYYYRVWIAEDEFKEMLDILTEQVRLWEGQSPQPSTAVIDSQSVRSSSL